MTNHLSAHKNGGFTLIETIIYMGLFGILIAGVLGTAWPFLSGADRVSRKVLTESESAFAMRKIHTALASSTCSISVPASDTIRITHYNTSGTGCNSSDYETITLTAGAFTIAKNTGSSLPFTSDRVVISNFVVGETAPRAGFPRYVEYSFTGNTVAYGPIRQYFIF